MSADVVAIVEKLTNPPPEQNLRKNASTGLRNNKICKKLDTKEGCTSLGTCVWVTGTEKSSKISVFSSVMVAIG